MKKIFYLANLNPSKFGSIEEQAFLLAQALNNIGYKCYLGFVAEPSLELRKLFENTGAELVDVYCGNTAIVGNAYKFKIKEILFLYKFILTNNIDLIDLNFVGLTNLSIIGIYFTRAKIIFTERASGLPFTRSILKNITSRFIHLFISRRVSKYVGISNYVLNRFEKSHHINKNKSQLIYNGVNLDRFKVRSSDDIRNELGLPCNKIIICAVAMLIPEKGIHILLKATADVIKKHPYKNIQLLIVGEGYFIEELLALANNLQISNFVTFLGKRSDVHLIVAAADMIVVPSLWEEAFGRIVTEAMATSRPVIASNIGGIPELVDSGVTGLLFEPGNIDELSAAMLRLIENPVEREAMGIAGLSKATAKFNMKEQIHETVSLYRQVLNDD